MRLIDLDELLKFPMRRYTYDRENGDKHFINGVESVLEYAENLLTVDAVPVRHGYWVWHESDYEYECSACGCRFDYERTYLLFDHNFEYASYCPNCGANMDGDEI